MKQHNVSCVEAIRKTVADNGNGNGYPNDPNNPYPDDRDRNGNVYGGRNDNGRDPGTPPELTLLWESANPIRAASVRL